MIYSIIKSKRWRQSNLIELFCSNFKTKITFDRSGTKPILFERKLSSGRLRTIAAEEYIIITSKMVKEDYH